MIAGKVDGAVGLQQSLITGIIEWRTTSAAASCIAGGLRREWRRRRVVVDPRALVVRDHPPVHVQRLLKFLAVARMQTLNRLSALGELVWEAELGEVREHIEAVAAHQHTAFAEHPRRRQPDGTQANVAELEATVDVVVLLPESPALPRDFECRRIGAFVDNLFVWRAEIVRNLSQDYHR